MKAYLQERNCLLITGYIDKNDSAANPLRDFGAGNTALHLAASKGADSMVYCIMDRGLNILRGDLNIQNDRGETVLHLAARHGHPSVIKIIFYFLLKEGYDIDHVQYLDLHKTDNQGNTAYQCAVNRQDEATAQFLQYPLHAAIKQDQRLYQIMLEKDYVKKHLNQQDGQGNTPLHIAIMHHKENIVQELLQKGANVSICNQAGLTALDLVQQSNFSTSIKTMLQETTETKFLQ